MTTQAYIRFEAGLASDPLVRACVTKMRGHEAINGLYRFELDLDLVDEKQGSAFTRDCADLNIDQLMLNTARLIWLDINASNQKEERALHGIVESFEIVSFNNARPLCRVVLRPRLWKLTRSRRSRVFLKKSVQDVIEQLMEDAGLASSDYRFVGTMPTTAREYITQYDETDFAFLCRWLEHEGVYFYFEQQNTGGGDGDHEVIVFCGDGATQADARAGTVSYEAASNSQAADDVRAAAVVSRISAAQVAQGVQAQPAVSALEYGEEEWLSAEHVRGIALAQGAPIREIVLNEYDWKNPSTSLVCSEQVADAGNGTLEEIDNQYTTSSEGTRLARIRKQEILAREKLFNVASNCVRVECGTKLTVRNHARSSFNAAYLAVEINHYATQKVDAGGGSFSASYRNSIVAIPSDPENRPFRPARVTPWPKVSGVVRATVQSSRKSGISTPFGKIAQWDAEMQPDIDADGNYKVQLGFDREARTDGNSSSPVRMAQPYAGGYKGQPMGIHFPLHAATEVILTHVNGNPDRPVIAGAMPNRNTDPTSVSYERRQSANAIVTQGNNKFIMGDSKFARSVDIRAGNSRSRMKMTNFGVHELAEIDGNPSASAAVTSEVLSANLTTLSGDIISNTGFYSWGADAFECKIGASEKYSLIAGYPLILNTIRAIKLAFIHTDDWARMGMEDAGVSGAIESAVMGVKAVAFFIARKTITDKFIKTVMKKVVETKYFPATRERMMLKLGRVSGGVANDAGKLAAVLAKLAALPATIAMKLAGFFTVDPSASLLCYGVRIQRAPKGSIIEAVREGEHILIATEVGAIDLHAGDNIDLVAEKSVGIEASDAVSLTAKGGGLEVGEDKVRMVSKNWITKIQMDDNELALINAKSGKRHHVTLGKDDFIAYGGDIHLSSDDGATELFLGKDGKARLQSTNGVVDIKVGGSFISIKNNTISVQAAGDLKLCAAGKVEIDGKAGVMIKGQKVSLRGMDVEMLAATSAKVDAPSVNVAGVGTAIGNPNPLVPMPPIPVIDVPLPAATAPATPPPFTTVDEAVALQTHNTLVDALRKRRAAMLGMSLNPSPNFS
jgi:uncharacterized protein involved in type VI secretion and phage assembly/uncharacterized protein (DUF2345 family)